LTKKVDQVVKPTVLAKELGIPPQVVFGWIRRGLVTSHECICGHKYLLRHEIKEFLTRREAEEKTKQEKIVRELAGEE
jgi:hypothetical protein